MKPSTDNEQSLIHAKAHQNYKHIFDSTRALFLFGTPIQGIEVDAILEMIDDTFPNGSSRRGLVQHLKEDSSFLRTQREDINALWGRDLEIFIASFYETQNTKTIAKVGHKRPVLSM